MFLASQTIEAKDPAETVGKDRSAGILFWKGKDRGGGYTYTSADAQTETETETESAESAEQQNSRITDRPFKVSSRS